MLACCSLPKARAYVQIAMFAAPVVCLVGWVYGYPFALDMDPLLVIVLALAVLHTCAPRAGLL